MNYPDYDKKTDRKILGNWQPESIIQVNQQYILLISEQISNDKNCKFRQAALRIFNHILASMDDEGKVSINARQLSKNLGVHYDTTTTCIKYLKYIDVIKTENNFISPF